jgi:ApbE superfamily uncharacterized protein (UPF0280 family)
MPPRRRRFTTILDELCEELPLLRSEVTSSSPAPYGTTARRMDAAVRPYASKCFITRMAAVAGAVADEILAAMLAATDLDRAYVNNGGDIAVYLAAGQSFVIGMVDRPDHPGLFGKARISAGDGIGGIATSGWRGRSFSLGIADAVTVLGASAAAADAAATVIANAVDLPDHSNGHARAGLRCRSTKRFGCATRHARCRRSLARRNRAGARARAKPKRSASCAPTASELRRCTCAARRACCDIRR